MPKIFNFLINKFFSFLLILLISFVLSAALNVALAQDSSVRESGDLVFYEGNDCKQDILFTYDSTFAVTKQHQTHYTSTA
jgi:hypothetical protein